MTGEPAVPARDGTPPLDLILRVGGGVLVVWLTVLSAVVEAFFVPLRIDGQRAPMVLVLAIGGNLVLPWLARWLTGRRGLTMLPGLLWFLVILTFAGITAEGDVVLAGNDWVALALLLLGAVAAGLGTYLGLLGVRPVDRSDTGRTGR